MKIRQWHIDLKRRVHGYVDGDQVVLGPLKCGQPDQYGCLSFEGDKYVLLDRNPDKTSLIGLLSEIDGKVLTTFSGSVLFKSGEGQMSEYYFRVWMKVEGTNSYKEFNASGSDLLSVAKQVFGEIDEVRKQNRIRRKRLRAC